MASFTRKAIIASFLKLLNERALNQITVKDIVEDCGINRNSFYYHFADMPTLVEVILKEEADKIIREHGSVNSLEDCLYLAIDFALNNRRAAMHIYNSASREAYDRYLDDVSQYVVEQYIDTAVGVLPIAAEDRETIVKFFKCELVGFVLDWMADGMRYDIRKQVGRVCDLFEGTAKTAFERCMEKQ